MRGCCFAYKHLNLILTAGSAQRGVGVSFNEGYLISDTLEFDSGSL